MPRIVKHCRTAIIKDFAGFAVYLLAGISTVVCHADIGTTLDIYTHAINKDKLVAQNQIMKE